MQPTFFKPGTDRVRMGVLATLVDMVAGSPAHAIINPTIDLRVSLLEHAPTSGRDRAGVLPGQDRPAPLHRRDAAPHRRSVAPVRPLGVHVHEPAARGRPGATRRRARRTSWVADVRRGACSCASRCPARSRWTSTRSSATAPTAPSRAARRRCMAELAGERALADHDGEHEVVDLEIRYLNRVMNGPGARHRRGDPRRRRRDLRAGPDDRTGARRAHRLADDAARPSRTPVTGPR